MTSIDEYVRTVVAEAFEELAREIEAGGKITPAVLREVRDAIRYNYCHPINGG